jgi:hypothetical protein
VVIVAGWIIMAVLALWIARTLPAPTAVGVWIAVTGLACALGGFAISRQPVGVATLGGRIGSAAVRWGFRASNGRLVPAVLISWLVWTIIGGALILALRMRSDLPKLFLVLAIAVDAAVLLYVIGVMLSSFRGRAPASLIVIELILTAMIVSSVALWKLVGTPWAIRTALLVAAGPTVAIGGGYGLFLLVTLTVGRNARWN